MSNLFKDLYEFDLDLMDLTKKAKNDPILSECKYNEVAYERRYLEGVQDTLEAFDLLEAYKQWREWYEIGLNKTLKGKK